MYLSPNFKSLAAAKRAIKAGEIVTCFAPGMGEVPVNGKAYVEGPHYPEPHRWYAQATIVEGKVVKLS